MKNTEQIKIEIITNLNNLIEQILDLRFYINVQKEFYKNVSEEGKYHCLYKESPQFFNCFIAPSIPFTIIQIAKIYDKKQSFGIEKMINEIEKNVDIVCPTGIVSYNTKDGRVEFEFKYFIAGIRQDLLNMKELHDKIKIWRNKYVAHNDKRYFGKIDDLKKDAKVVIGDVERLNDFAYHICELFTGALFHYPILQPDNIDEMAKDMNILFENATLGMEIKSKSKEKGN